MSSPPPDASVPNEDGPCARDSGALSKAPLSLELGQDPESDFPRAESTRNRAASLGGTAVALLTFALFFLYPQYRSGAIDAAPFQLTVRVIVLSVFFLSYSSVYYGRQVGIVLGRQTTARIHSATAGLLQLIGLALLSLQPALVLFTIHLTGVAILALVMWIVFLVLVALGRRDFYPAM